MALVQQLPNGHLIVLLTPREAVMLSDQILEPSDYPWQASEAQVTAFEVKQRLKGALEAHLHAEVAVISSQVIEANQQAAREEARERRRLLAQMTNITEPEDPPDGEPDDEPDDEDENEDE